MDDKCVCETGNFMFDNQHYKINMKVNYINNGNYPCTSECCGFKISIKDGNLNIYSGIIPTRVPINYCPVCGKKLNSVNEYDLNNGNEILKSLGYEEYKYVLADGIGSTLSNIEFKNTDKTINIDIVKKYVYVTDNYDWERTPHLTPNELNAIYLIFKELGWYS